MVHGKISSALVLGTLLCHAVFAAEPLTVSTANDGLKEAETYPPKLKEQLKDVEDVPGLPRVLLIGDSISMDYTLLVRKMLKDKANVHRPPENCGDTRRGVARLESWLGSGKWDVIHFNFGLHDLKHVDKDGKMVDKKNGPQNITAEEYEKNLRGIVSQLKKTGAKLIWRNTTPIPEGVGSRVKGTELQFNEIAASVMKENEIPIHDLHAFVVQHPKHQLPKNVHFTKEGSEALAGEVVKQIELAMKK